MEQTANDVSSIISNGILDANDNNCCVKNVGDAFAIFHARAPRKGSVAVPGLKDIEVYCPKEDDSTGWTNILSPDYTVYEEYYTGVKGETPEYIEEKRPGTGVDALTLALQAGNSKAANSVMLGALCKKLGFDRAATRRKRTALKVLLRKREAHASPAQDVPKGKTPPRKENA